MTKAIIVGGGSVGQELIQYLPGATVIESDPGKVVVLRKIFDNVAIVHGDASDEEVLKHAGIETADSVVLASNRDTINIKVAKIAARYHIPQIIGRVNSRRNLDRYLKYDAEIVIGPHEQLANLIHTFLHPDEYHVAEIVVTKESLVLGTKLENLKLPTGAMVAAILKGDYLVAPHGHVTIEEGDVLSIHSAARDAQEISDMITGGSKIQAPFNHIIVPLHRQEDVKAFMEATLIADRSDAELILVADYKHQEMLQSTMGLADMDARVTRTVTSGNLPQMITSLERCIAEMGLYHVDDEGVVDLHQMKPKTAKKNPRGRYLETGSFQSESNPYSYIVQQDENLRLGDRNHIRRHFHQIDPGMECVPKVDCVVLPPEDLTFRQMLWRRSTVLDVVHDLKIPVLVARTLKRYRSILLLVDGSEESLNVVYYAIKIAKLFGSKVHALTIHDPENQKTISETIKFIRRTGRTYQVEVTVHYVQGNPTVDMVRHVKSGKYDLTLIKWICPTLKTDMLRMIINRAPGSVLVVP